MLSGQNGVKYGLQLRGKSKSQRNSSTNEAKKPVIPNVFGDEEESDIESEIAREGLKKRSKREVEEMHAAALAADKNIFDYDGVYDEMKGQRVKKQEQENTRGKSKYIEALLAKAKNREIEQEVARERMLTKERAKEEHLFGDKEKFVTGAYKRKLAEQQKWIEEEKRREALEAAMDVTKREDLSDFYRNVLDTKVQSPSSGSIPKVVSKSTAFVGVGTERVLEPSSVPIPDPEEVKAAKSESSYHPKTEPELEKRSESQSNVANASIEQNDSLDVQRGETIPEDKVALARERYLSRKNKKS